jgi:hypothetical protein
LLLFVLSIIVFLAGRLSLRHLDALIATGPAIPASFRWTDMLDFAVGFLWRGFAGSSEAVAHMQGLLFAGSLGFAAALLLYRLRYSAFTMQVDQVHDATPRRVVIMGLSELSAPADDAIKTASQMDLGTASAADLGRLPWQQNLRVLHHHFSPPRPEPGWVARRLIGLKLRREPGRCHVIVLPSPESRRQAQQFVEMAKACLARTAEISTRPADVEIEIWSDAANYNSLRSLRESLLSIIRSMRARPDVQARLDEISIDTTPGMKLFSIAGAAVTFASPLEFTYVETIAPNRVVAFDVRAEFRRHMRLPA